ncbi:MAG: aldehyde dehydrogenase family protein [Armatimonadota bacterium]|nr:aldehyde dehydrogenase family protein [Armatimonadota bacterium]
MRSFQLFIDGEYCNAASGQTYESINPATGEAVAEIALGGAEDVTRACETAQRAFDGDWGAMTSAERSAILADAADLIEERAEEFAELETLDVGKPITEATTIDVPVAVSYLRWYAAVTDAAVGETIDIPNAGQIDFSLYQPYGVVGGIAPWNFPLFLGVLKIGPALAMGNSMVFKPASITPMTSLLVCECFAQAGLPAGALNVVAGPGSSVGEAIVTDPHVRMVSFTGSTAVGRRVIELSARNITNTSMELGGKSPNIIFEDADFDQAVAGAVFGLLLNNGQNCIAGTRLLVQQSIHDDVCSAVAEKLDSLRVGNPMDPETQLGAIVSQEQFEKVTGYIQSGREEGATVAAGGEVPGDPDLQNGWFVQPTLLTDCTNDMEVSREEIFGPVLVAIPFEDEADAIAIANDTPYGLGSGVFTTDGDRAQRMARALQSGTVYVNTYNQVYPQSPFPGWKQSGTGVERGVQGLLTYTRYKNVIWDISGEAIPWF